MALGVCVIIMTKYLTENDLKMEECLGSESEDIVHHDREGIAADWAPSAVRKMILVLSSLSPLFLFILSQPSRRAGVMSR